MEKFFGVNLKANPVKFASKIALIYAVTAWMWLIASDNIILWITRDAQKVLRLEFLYETLFVVISAVLLARLIRRFFTMIRTEDEKFREIAQGISVASGDAFFRALVKHLAKALDYNRVIICEFLGGNKEMVRNAAEFCDDEIRENIFLPLNDQLELILKTRRPIYCPENAAVSFPELKTIIGQKAEAVILVPMIGSSAKLFGAIIMASNVPIKDFELAEEILPVFAVRCAVELERKEIENRLIDSERQFKSLLENVQLSAVILDVNAHLVYCNNFFLELTGWRREDIIGRNWFSVMAPPETRKELESDYSARIAENNLPLHEKYDIMTRDGKRRTIKWNRTLLRDENGDLTNIASLGEEVSTR